LLWTPPRHDHKSFRHDSLQLAHISLPVTLDICSEIETRGLAADTAKLSEVGAQKTPKGARIFASCLQTSVLRTQTSLC